MPDSSFASLFPSLFLVLINIFTNSQSTVARRLARSARHRSSLSRRCAAGNQIHRIVRKGMGEVNATAAAEDKNRLPPRGRKMTRAQPF